MLTGVRMIKKPRKNPLRRCPFDASVCVYPCNKLVHGRMDANLTDKAVISVLGLARMSWWRYRRGQQRPPLSVCGYLSALSGVFHWAGWRKFNINPGNGKLFFEGLRDGWSPEDVVSIHWLRGELASWRALDEKRRRQMPAQQPDNVLKFPGLAVVSPYKPAA
jgi:hypothetical protein